MDDLDRELISLLRADARASVASLASTLNVARGTVQNRMARLEQDGTIAGYTVRLRPQVDELRIRAQMTIAVDGNSADAVLRSLRGDPAVETLHTTNGRWDIIAELRANSLEDFDKVLRRKEREVAARADKMTVSLVGYTNAGKSTLLNTLTGSDEVAENKLFATLDTRTRRWQLPDWGPVLLSDTVGFIRDLPHRLIASFKATLEEARQADLLLHIADASNPAALQQIAAVYRVLEELGIREKDTILVLNQVDRITEPGVLDTLLRDYSHAIPVSAKTGQGLTRLATTVSEALTQHFLDVDVETDVANGRLLAYLARHGEVLSRTFTGDRVSVHCRLPKKYAGRISPEEAAVRLRSAELAAGRSTGGLFSGNGQVHANGIAQANDAESEPIEDVA